MGRKQHLKVIRRQARNHAKLLRESAFLTLRPEVSPVLRRINEALGCIKSENPHAFPDFSKSNSVICLSDYGGEHEEAVFQTIGLLFFDWNDCGSWVHARDRLRRERIKDNRSMEFKKLIQDRVRLQALPQFLNISENINGLLIVFMVDKKIDLMFGEIDGMLPEEVLRNEGLGEWRSHVAEKVVRILHFQALLASGLTYSHNNYGWFTDRDAIIEGKRAHQIGELLRRVMNIYCPHSFKHFGHGRAFERSEDETLVIPDLLCLPDLACGALTELAEASILGPTESLVNSISMRTRIILDWLSKPSGRLRKMICRIEQASEDGGIQVDFVGIKPGIWHV